jgi:hypothetical protein
MAMFAADIVIIYALATYAGPKLKSASSAPRAARR